MLHSLFSIPNVSDTNKSDTNRYNQKDYRNVAYFGDRFIQNFWKEQEKITIQDMANAPQKEGIDTFSRENLIDIKASTA